MVCRGSEPLVQKLFKQNRSLGVKKCEQRNWHPAPVQYALSAIISGLNGYYAGRSQIARIYEVFPLLCPMRGGQMRLIAFVTVGTQIQKILNHIGVDS